LDATTLGFADDLALIHTSAAAMQSNLDRLAAALARFGLKINIKKTEAMCVAEVDAPHRRLTLAARHW
jgi:hypothetical protein